MWSGPSVGCSPIRAGCGAALGRLLTDQGFRNGFFLHPARACSQVGIQLTSREFEALFRVPRAVFASLGARLDDRVCRLHVQQGEIAGQGE